MGNAIGEAAYNIKLTDENKLGEGNYAQVYKIIRKKDGMLCAAKLYKVPIIHMLSDDEKAYERETKILKEA
jgi:hypothetical protein